MASGDALLTSEGVPQFFQARYERERPLKTRYRDAYIQNRFGGETWNRGAADMPYRQNVSPKSGLQT